MSCHGLARLLAASVIAAAAVLAPVQTGRAIALTQSPASSPSSAARDLSAPPVATVVPRAASYSKPRREVFGYFNASTMASADVGYPSWDFNNLTTLAFFGLHVYPLDGSLRADSQWTYWNSSSLTALVTAAHAAGVKVVPSILLHDYASTKGGTVNTAMCQGLAAAPHTIGDIVSEVQAKRADGVNIDYEGSDQLCPGGQYQHQMLDTMMQQLRAAMPTTYISIATYNASYQGGYFDIPGLNPYVDSFFVMDYDSDSSNYRYLPLHCATYCFSPTAPLNTYYYNDTNSVAGYLGLVPASKIILGVPYYGYTACVPGVNRPGPNAASYTDLSKARWVAPRYVDSVAMNGSPDVYNYALGRDPYTHTDTYATWYSKNNGCWRESVWDDTVSLAAKYDLVNKNNLRGVGIFTLDYGGGSPELWQTLKGKFGGCPVPTLTSTATSPQPVGGSVTYTAATSCSAPVYAFWLQLPSGAWYQARGYSTSASWTWNTSGLVPGDYNVVAWVKQAYGDTNQYDTFASMAFTFSGCATIGLDPALPSPQPVGTVQSFTGTTSGCPSPDFEFWIQSPGGAWHVAQPYSNKSRWAWNTSGVAPGTYNLALWVRQHGSGNAYDQGGGGPYTLAGCEAASVTPPAGTSSEVGGTIAVTAGATGCPNPEFEFWLRAPGKSWAIAQAYGPSTAFNWNTNGLRPGAYQIAIWARQHGSASPAGYDAAAGGVYPLTGCASVSLAGLPAPPVAHGTAVAFAAAPSGCSHPQYSYWFKPVSGGVWTQVPYSSSTSWTWNTSGLRAGAYYILAWIRQTGSGTTYDSSAYVTYTLT